MEGPGSFDFLGFAFYWARIRKDRRWIIKLKTSRNRLTRSLKRVTQWCKRNRHVLIPEQHRELVLKLRGHYQYYGIIGNGKALSQFHLEVRRIWRKWLNRRSNRRHLWREKFVLLLKRYPLPAPGWLTPPPIHSETMPRGAGCVSRARPDLWGAGESNLPRLPDHQWAKPVALILSHPLALPSFPS